MSSPAQILANQANAALSTGPRTPSGKVAVAANALSHGLSSAFTVLAHEDQDQFNALLDGLRTEHQPSNHHQGFLVDQLAKSMWQLSRAQRLETLALELLAESPLDAEDPDARIVTRMLTAGRDPLATFQRFAAQAERAYYKAYRELAASKQVQFEHEAVAALDSGRLDTRTIGRIINAPVPSHPGYGNQYAAPNAPAKIKANPPKPSLRSQMPENLALCL